MTSGFRRIGTFTGSSTCQSMQGMPILFWLAVVAIA